MNITDFKFVTARYPLSALTRIRTGGPAAYLAAVTNRAELAAVVAYAQGQGLPFCVVGNGTNIVASDEGFSGIAIRLGGQFRSVSLDQAKRVMTAGSGAALIRVGVLLARLGYQGCAYMGVIPGTVGGAVRMNAGIAGSAEIKNDLLHVRVFDVGQRTLKLYTARDLAFGYRTSLLAGSPDIVVEATFGLPGHRETRAGAALEAIKDLHRHRRMHNPQHPRTFGSTFKNPPGHPRSAGWLLERVQMKGLRCGGAMVAREHANWILNVDNAASADVRALIATGQQRVFEQFGIRLEREVVYLPEDTCGPRR
jgi:UDP-N-acetylmuramate dehydrogenase